MVFAVPRRETVKVFVLRSELDRITRFEMSAQTRNQCVTDGLNRIPNSDIPYGCSVASFNRIE